MNALRFDWTISFGTMIHLGLLVLTLVGLYYGIKNRIQRVEERVSELPEIKREIDVVSTRVAEIAPKVNSLWEWFTSQMERRKPR